MNRDITEPWTASLPPDRQGEFFHRYILGVYELYRRLTTRFPEILFESCASGGGRFDPGLLAFAPQAWTSDGTDAVERLRIQWGTSLAYPLSSMAAHVSAVPNHQVGRVTPLSTRAAVAFFGVFGYELDPTALTADGARRRSPTRSPSTSATATVPARALRPAGEPVRGRPRPGRLDGRRADGSATGGGRQLPDPRPARSRPGPAAAPRSRPRRPPTRSRPGPRDGDRLVRGEHRGAERRRADGAPGSCSTSTARDGRPAATSGRGCSCSSAR